MGEVRGAEALDLVRAFNTGHYGAGTIHANSAYDALLALESLILQSGLDVPARAVKEMVSRAIQIVVQVNQLPDHSRKVIEIAEIQGLDYERSVEFPPYKLTDPLPLRVLPLRQPAAKPTGSSSSKTHHPGSAISR